MESFIATAENSHDHMVPEPAAPSLDGGCVGRPLGSYSPEMAADEVGFAQFGIQYHSTADVDEDIDSSYVLESWARAHAALSDELAPCTKSDLEAGGVDLPNPDASIYQSDVLKLLFGNR